MAKRVRRGLVAKSAAVVVVVIAAAASCSTSTADIAEDAPDPTAAETTVAPAPPSTFPDGFTVTGDDYSFMTPDGWGTPDVDAPEGVDRFALDLTDRDGFADNVNVVLSPLGEVPLVSAIPLAQREFEQMGMEITVRDRLVVAGSEAGQLSGTFDEDGAQYVVEQFYVPHDGQTFIITFSFSSTVGRADREAFAESVLATWRWE